MSSLLQDGTPDVPTLTQWLQKNCKRGDRIGVDANLYSTRAWNTLASAFDNEGCILTAVRDNLVDKVWTDQPSQPMKPINPLDVKFAGKLIDEKLRIIRGKMTENSAKVLVVTALDEVACKLSKL